MKQTCYKNLYDYDEDGQRFGLYDFQTREEADEAAKLSPSSTRVACVRVRIK